MPRVEDVDEYIASAPDLTRPILVKLRRIFLTASSNLEESIKWNVPCYSYKGMVGGFAAFKQHVTWGLWKAGTLDDPDGLIGGAGVMRGGKIMTPAEVPSASKLIALIKQVIALNEAGVKPATPRPPLPADFAATLNADSDAKRQYAAFTPACQWQYVNWITQAKRSETRARRIQAAAERISTGKPLK